MRLIDADALKNRLTALVRGGTNLNYCIADMIDRAITIEPERKKGKWLMDGEKCGELMWRCSECRVSEAVPTATSFVSGIVYPQWKYCPNCGVNMMEEGDHE